MSTWPLLTSDRLDGLLHGPWEFIPQEELDNSSEVISALAPKNGTYSFRRSEKVDFEKARAEIEATIERFRERIRRTLVESDPQGAYAATTCTQEGALIEVTIPWFNNCCATILRNQKDLLLNLMHQLL